jgi:serine/threonine protein phosphatase PrpC
MIAYSAATHPGRKHTLNEDNVGWNADKSLWLVADGMGGHAAGEVASLIAKEKVLEQTAAGAVLMKAVNLAHEAVRDAALADSERAGMGTTIVAARIDGYIAELVWVGDSRAYLLRDGVLETVTSDHSFMQMLIDNQQLTLEEAHKHPQRNIVTQVLGVGDPSPGRVTVRLQNLDRILLCSDGLNDELLHDEIAEILRENPDVEVATSRLIEAACDAGGRDNVSAILIQYEGESAPDPEATTIRRRVPEQLSAEQPGSRIGRIASRVAAFLLTGVVVLAVLLLLLMMLF